MNHTDFDYIALTHKEYKRLKKLSRSPTGLASSPHESGLMNANLISRAHYGSNNPDAACLPTVISIITQEGRDYILYRKRKRTNRILNYGIQILNLIFALIAAITGIISLLLR